MKLRQHTPASASRRSLSFLRTGLSIFTIAGWFVAANGHAQFLFDATKLETVGNADWVLDADAHNYNGSESNPQRFPTAAQSGVTGSTAESYWTGGLSAWGIALVQRGKTVETLPISGSITYGISGNAQDLSHYKVFVVPEPNELFTATEKTAILNFVKNGGSLFMIADHADSDRNGDSVDSRIAWNDLMASNSVQANPFGLSFNATDESTNSTLVETTNGNPLTRGAAGNVTRYSYNGGSTLTLDITQNASVKGAVWFSSKTATNVMVAYGTFGMGRFVAVGDSSPFDDGTGDPNDGLFDNWYDANNASLNINASLWLAVPEPNALLLCGSGLIFLGSGSRRLTRKIPVT